MAKFEAEFTRQFHQALTSIFQKSDNHSIIYIIIWRQSGDDVAEGIGELRAKGKITANSWVLSTKKAWNLILHAIYERRWGQAKGP